MPSIRRPALPCLRDPCANRVGLRKAVGAATGNELRRCTVDPRLRPRTRCRRLCSFSRRGGCASSTPPAKSSPSGGCAVAMAVMAMLVVALATATTVPAVSMVVAMEVVALRAALQRCLPSTVETLFAAFRTSSTHSTDSGLAALTPTEAASTALCCGSRFARRHRRRPDCSATPRSPWPTHARSWPNWLRTSRRCCWRSALSRAWPSPNSHPDSQARLPILLPNLELPDFRPDSELPDFRPDFLPDPRYLWKEQLSEFRSRLARQPTCYTLTAAGGRSRPRVGTGEGAREKAPLGFLPRRWVHSAMQSSVPHPPRSQFCGMQLCASPDRGQIRRKWRSGLSQNSPTRVAMGAQGGVAWRTAGLTAPSRPGSRQ
mmetsp:Transcript_40275/g.94910  ORF Transcript_40275/g.94910 Transcript_40275/m.94910 type:complete len:374 (-) Transcript_40275:442-1563(-)